MPAGPRAWANNAVIWARDVVSPDSRAAWRRRVEVAGSRELSSADVLDDRYGHPLPHPPLVDVSCLLPVTHGIDQPAWTVSLGDEPDPIDAARACFATHGVWPISFSYPSEPLPLLDHPSDLVAPIVPGYPYSFDDPDEYLRTYQRSYLGITHRKAGWDCFRHVEIMAAGAVPLMPDAADVPRLSMVHYPTRAFARVADLVRRTGAPPDDATRTAFRTHFEQHLTSAAMARYVLGMSGLADASRVLFVDERLPSHADYQSVLTLIGLKQVLGDGCHVMFDTDYVYADTTTDTATLYGRGFGYTRVVDASTRSTTETGTPLDLDALDAFDAVVVGSIARNDALARDLLRRFPAERTVWVHGEDTPPLPDVAHDYRTSGVNVFVRAIHTGP